MKKIISVCLLIICLLAISFSGFAPKVLAETNGYAKIDLGSLGGGSTKAHSINNNNQIVGQSNINGEVHHAFLWEDGQMTDLGTLGGSNSIAYGINNHGQIVGESQIASDSATHAFLWENGQMTDLGAPQEIIEFVSQFPHNLRPAINSSAHGINENGHIVGKAKVSINSPSFRYHAVLWRNDEIIDLQEDMTSVTTIRFTGSVIESYANAINDSGQIVGSMTFPARPGGDSLYINSLPQEAFLWQDGSVNVVGYGSTAFTEASDINNNGQITISNFNTGYPGGVFVTGSVWPASNLPSSCDGSGGAQASEAVSINNSGDVFGVKAEVGGPELGQGYYICQNGLITDFGNYPNFDFTILGAPHYVRGGINDDGNAVAENLFFKKIVNPPPPEPYNNGYNSGYNNNYNSNYNNNYNSNYQAPTGVGMFYNTNYNNGYNNNWNSNYNNGWQAPW